MIAAYGDLGGKVAAVLGQHSDGTVYVVVQEGLSAEAEREALRCLFSQLSSPRLSESA